MKTAIHLNQVGYFPSQKKTAAVIGNASNFSVINNATDKILYSGKLSEPVNDLASGDTVRTADFSRVMWDGEYYITVGKTVSPLFKVSSNPYRDLRTSLQKFYYYSRCGMDLTEKYAGIYKRRRCHMPEVKLYSDKKVLKDVSGGWHDAGDYGKFTVTACNAVAHLLYSYELYPECFGEQPFLPEGGFMPSILNECKYELLWLMKMQDRDGGVFHKVTSLEVAENILPHLDTEDFFLFGKSDSATLSFCAAAALASRIYRQFDSNFSQMLLAASLNAWNYIGRRKKLEQYTDPPDVRSLEYDEFQDKDFKDDIFWASAELYSATGEKIYLKQLLKYYEQIDTTAFKYSSTGGFGAVSYLFCRKTKLPDLTEALKNAFIFKAENLISFSKHSGYLTAIDPSRFTCGSNCEIASNAVILSIAYKLTLNPAFAVAVNEQINYLLGKNPLGISYITGFGTYQVLHPHHRPSTSDKVLSPIPGMLVGGADMMRTDEYSRWHIVKGTPPSKCYLDKEYCYSTNDVSIYWNAPAVSAFAFLESLYDASKKEV